MTKAEDNLLWQLEEDYWLCGCATRAQTTDIDSIAAFGGHVGVVTGDALIKAHENGRTWTKLKMRDKCITRPSIGIAVMGYTAEAVPDDDKGTQAMICTSVWVRKNGIWSHVQHQQAPT